MGKERKKEYGDISYYSLIYAGNIEEIPTVSDDDITKIEARIINDLTDRYKNKCFSVCPSQNGCHPSLRDATLVKIGEKYAVLFNYEVGWCTNYDESESDKGRVYVFLED